MFRGIDRRLAGIGVISVYSSYVFSWYYNVIVSWSLLYVFASFQSTLPWSKSIPAKNFSCNAKTMSRAEQYYRINVIRIVDEKTCKKWVDGDPTKFSFNALGACTLTWIFIFFCVFKGVKSSSWIVWITVPMPTLFVLVMIINGATLDGAGDGVKRYFSGTLRTDPKTNKVITTTAAE